VLFALAVPVPAQPPPIPTISLSLQPAALSGRALHYEFLPEVREEIPGNAVIYYLRGTLMLSDSRGIPADHPMWKWLEMPIKDLPKKEVRQFIDTQKNVFRELDLATRCSQCDWQLDTRMRTEGVYLLLPEIQHMRSLASLLQLKARLEIAERNFDQAIHTLQAGFKLARNTNRSPTLISALVGIAIAGMMAAQVDDLVQQPGAPNLYWALTYLPSPFIELRRAMESERMWLDGTFSGLRELAADHKAGPLSQQQVQNLVDKSTELFQAVDGSHPAARDTWMMRAYLTGVAVKGYPEGKQFLLTRGWTAEQVEAMPMLQVAFLYALAHYDAAFDDMLKWVDFPYYQAHPGLKRWSEQLRQERGQAEAMGSIPLASVFLPAVEKVIAARTRIDRKIGALRCIEALRLYAVGHDSKWPEKLEQITEVPIPKDPVTGKPFEYSLKGEVAVLAAPAPVGEEPHQGNSLHYELTIKHP
jgi:hypothetical protein